VKRFSFNIDLRKKDGSSSPKSSKQKSHAPPVADGFEMSGDLADQRQFLRAWPQFQREMDQLPDLIGTLEEWDDTNLGAEYVRIYQVSKHKILESEPGFSQSGKMENHVFFTPDGTKHLVSRLLTRPHDRINEMRLSLDGQLVRLYYQKSDGAVQNLDDLFEHGLLGLEEDVGRFAHFPHYHMTFFILMPKGEHLESTFRGVCYYDHETGRVLTEEAGQIS
jgi:hypothetical protein